MNCGQFQELLQRRLDGEPVPQSAEPDGHLSECADCRGLQAAAGRLLEGLRLRAALVPPVNLAAAIAVRVLRDRRQRRQARRRWTMVAASLAAGLLLALLVGFSDDARSYWDKALVWLEPSAPPRAAESEEGAGPPVSAPSVRETVALAGTAVVSLTRRTADETLEDTKLLASTLPAPPVLPMPPLTEPPPVPALEQAGQHVASGFEPVTSSARRALNLFLRDTGTARNQ